MANKNQVINGLATYIENHMIPKETGNYQIALGLVKAWMLRSPDSVWNLIKGNALVNMSGFLTDETLDIHALTDVFGEALGNHELVLTFDWENILGGWSSILGLGNKYTLALSKDDIHTLKNYIERS
jgi:hypothetical protein